jgi:hypothetical protein
MSAKVSQLSCAEVLQLLGSFDALEDCQLNVALRQQPQQQQPPQQQQQQAQQESALTESTAQDRGQVRSGPHMRVLMPVCNSCAAAAPMQH